MRPPEKFRTATRFCAADQRYKGRKPEPRAYVQGLDVRTMSGRGRNIFLDILFIEQNVNRPLQCAGLNRHEAEDESSLRERSSDLLGLESCAGYREVHSEA